MHAATCGRLSGDLQRQATGTYSTGKRTVFFLECLRFQISDLD